MKIVKLTELSLDNNTHNPKISKKVMIKNGQIPHLTNFSQGYFPPGETVEEHSHKDMYEIFFIEKGTATFKINGEDHKLKSGSCLTVELGDRHEIRNDNGEELVITYFGVEV